MKRKASPRPQSATSPHAAAALADRLHSAAIHLLRRLRRVDEATGLTAPKLSALSVIVYAGPISLGDLAAAEQVRPPTMTHIVRELAEAGLIRCQTDAHDKRVTRVQATTAGARLLRQGRGRRVALLAEWVKTLAAADFKRLADAIEIVERFARPQS